MKFITSLKQISVRLQSKAKGQMRSVRAFHLLKLSSAVCMQIASLYLVYILSPAEYGTFALVVSSAQLMYILTSGWSNGAIINLGSRSFNQTGSYKSIVYYRMCMVAATFAFVASSSFLAKDMIEMHMKIDGLYPYIFLLFIGYVLYDHASQLLYPGNKDLTQAALELSAALSLLFVMAFAVNNLRSYIVAYSFVSLIFALVTTYIFFSCYRNQFFKWSRSSFEGVFYYSAWQMISVVCIYVINMGMNFVLVISHVSLDQIGLYNFAFRLYLGFTPLFALLGVLMPKWVNLPHNDQNSIHNKILKIVSMIGMLYLAFGVALHPLLKGFDIQRYTTSITYFYWLFPAFIFSSYANLLNMYFSNTKNYRRGQVGTLINAGVLIVFCLPLTEMFEIAGLILVITLASASGAAYFYRANKIDMRTN